jgi:hypothetical protein
MVFIQIQLAEWPVWALLLPAILVFIAGWLFGMQYKMRTLSSQLRHTELERNHLHVQCMTLREAIDNQELDIKRYAAELQLYLTMQKQWIAEREQLHITLQQTQPVAAKSVPTPTINEGEELMIKILKGEIQQLKVEKEGLVARHDTQEQVMAFLTRENKRLREQANAQAV